ncbi:hypothetical protein GA0115251_11953 [Streptomyces sp. TverLS-915]|uniref:hypothetical protein n=1 Tax=Streptomyces sp. TverLS-915 TaxID=1839763 RepID=UPI00081F4A42|nr:hypothetical protein [Streptomyces sp. TverLS-915]SCD70480.1 hypothetical protein GA0115251_11953 [Streptomyces sp. TverLS-915]
MLLDQMARGHHRLEVPWADGGYTGSLVGDCLAALALILAIVKRSDDMRGFVVLPERWSVERLFDHEAPLGPVTCCASVKRPG